jgi:hypothetical protein
MRWIALIAALISLPNSAAQAQQAFVDTELVIAVDVSYSISTGEQDIQRAGYAAAFEDREVVAAITSGVHGSVAVTYVEWAGDDTQRTVLPWTVIRNQAEASAFAQELRDAEILRSGHTSISAALLYSASLFENNGLVGLRRVIDISGDGVNNGGPFVTEARRAVTARGITINGLPLMAGSVSGTAEAKIDEYYRDCVIGGAGAFSIPVRSWTHFAPAIRKKILFELTLARFAPQPKLLHLAAAAPMADCLVGEKRARKEYLRQLDVLTGGKSERWRPRQQDWPTVD